MVRVRFSILTSFVMLFSLFGSIPAQSSFVAIDECKLKYNFASPTSPISIGFPRVTEGVIPNYGSQRQLIIAVKFADADYNIENIGTRLEKAAKPGDVSKFFESVSYGRVKIEFDIYQEIITLSQPFDSYLGVNGPYSRDNNLNTAKIVEELRSVLQNKDKLPKYSALNVFLINKTPLQYTPQQALVGLGATFYPNHFYLPNLPDVSRTLMHEIGHLFGLIDTYAISENGREPENEVFFSLDLMTNSFQTLSSWNRWYLDWIIDSQVQCLEAELNNIEISLKALDSPGGLKMAVVKLSSTELLVIEARRGGKYDALINNSGIIVHHLDMNKPPMQQALSVIPKGKWNKEELKNNRRFSANYDDYVAKAGEYIYYESNGVLIQNIGNSEESFQLKLSSGKEAVKNLALAQTKPIKSTITCIKGKTVKKVTAVNPKCPKGYKKK